MIGDTGSEFAAEFDLACQQKQLPLFVLPPKSPKLNAHVERSHALTLKSSTRCTQTPTSHCGSIIRCAIPEHTYNRVRPNQSRAYLTPLEFVTRWKKHRPKAKCH
jgi:putative transposase